MLVHLQGKLAKKLAKIRFSVSFPIFIPHFPQYLNSGAGGISGVFLHDRHADDPPKHLLGWWSNNKETRNDR